MKTAGGGYAAAGLAVLICAAYPVATRAAVTGSFSPQELVTLRFGIGALLFLPYLMAQFRSIGRQVWLRGLALALFQGAGMGALVICGLQFAPANHQAALGPGVAPAWVACLGFLLFAQRPSMRILIGAALCALGVCALVCASVASGAAYALAGDLMFLAASAMGALYVLQLRRWGVPGLPAAAIVTVYSAALVVPWHLCSAGETLWRVAPLELAWQTLWQGVLIGCVALIAFNHAIARLGPERSSAMLALIPVVSATLALAFLGEVPSGAEIAAILAISIGVGVAASRPYRGSPASTSAATSRAACALSRPG